MRKKVLAFAVAAVLSINAAGAASLVVDGAQVQADVPPMIVDGRTLVPVRALFESLGATVDWDDATQTVTAAKEGTRAISEYRQHGRFCERRCSGIGCPRPYHCGPHNGPGALCRRIAGRARALGQQYTVCVHYYPRA